MHEAREALQVTLKWGNALLDARQFEGSGRLTIGTSPTDTFRLNVPGAEKSLVLARFGQGECEVLGPTGVKLALLHEGAGPAEVKVGPFRFSLAYVPVQPLEGKKRDEVDYAFLRALGSSALVGAFVLAAIASTDVEELAVTESLMPPRRFIDTVLTHPKKTEPKSAAVRPNGGARAKNKEGVQGDKSDHVKVAAPTKGDGKLDGKRREKQRAEVMKAGLLGDLNSGLGASGVFGPGGVSDGIQAALNNLRPGSGMGPSAGLGGMGSRGTGPGGGGHDLGIGLGHFGPGNGDGPPGGPTLNSGPRQEAKIISDPKKLESNCERTSIARVISRHASEIKACYETELNRAPELTGKVSVSFTIGGAGEVSESAIAQSTVPEAAALEKCILARLNRWRFPEPKGGVCVVNYPWHFKPAGME